jgi:hypothetical protein
MGPQALSNLTVVSQVEVLCRAVASLRKELCDRTSGGWHSVGWSAVR